jgi:hypothetical protein
MNTEKAERESLSQILMDSKSRAAALLGIRV